MSVLTEIKFDLNSFIFAAISQGSDSDFSKMGIRAPYPKAHSDIHGEHTLFLSFVKNFYGMPFLKAELIANQNDERVREVLIPAIPRFSIMHVASEQLFSSKDDRLSGDFEDAISWLMSGEKDLEQTNKNLATQSDIFTQELEALFDTSGQNELIGNLYIFIQANTSAILPSAPDIGP